MNFELTSAAKEDIEEIIEYTVETWGYNQAVKYEILLGDAITQIASDPRSPRFKQADYVRPGLKRYHVGRHYIYFKVSEDLVSILRILHDSRNQSQHL